MIYYDQVGSIVPRTYFESPQSNYDPFMLELIKNELVVPVDPMATLDRPYQTLEPFFDWLMKKKRAEKARKRFNQGQRGLIHGDKFQKARVHSDKFYGGIFTELKELGLAQKSQNGWYDVESQTAAMLMKFLASVVGGKVDMLPATDKVKIDLRKMQKDQSLEAKRQNILDEIIPFPERIELNRLRGFKDKHQDLLKTFKRRIESIVLNPDMEVGSMLYNNELKTLKGQKEELVERMNESQFANITFGTVCGLFGAYHGLTSAGTTTEAVLGALPGFAATIHAALKIETPEKVRDQTGLKYLALLDRRIGNRPYKPF